MAGPTPMPEDMSQSQIPVRVPLVREPWGFFKSLQVARRNLLEIIPEIATTQPIVTGRTGVRWHMVMDPPSLRHILRDKLEAYPKSVVTKRIPGPAIGDSLFIAEGSHWRWQRQAVAPVFRHRNIATLAPVMSAAVEASVERLSVRDGTVTDLFHEMVGTTFDVISNVTFSGGDAMDIRAVQFAIERYINSIARISMLDMIGAPGWIPRPSRMFGPKSLDSMKDIADDSIRHRRASGPKAVPDLLDQLLDAEDPETKRTMTAEELRDNLLTFIVAGHETTALTLSWALYLCAFDPEVQDRARGEAQSILKGMTATAEHAENLPFTRQIIEEALRLYPPAAILSRTAQEPDTICGREIRKGDTVMLPIYALHRNRDLWDDPDRFDPDRFASGHKIDRFAYLPFGDGPKMCIGMSFAMMEAQIILATLLSRFRFTRVEGLDPKPVMLLTLRPEGGVRLRVDAL